MLINFNECSWLLSLSSWSLPSLFLAFTCTKRECCLCIHFHKPQKLFHMSPPYLPICGIYLPFQVNLYVPNSKPSNKHSVLYARIAHVSTNVVLIFRVRQVILKRSGLRSSFTRKWLVTEMPSPMLKSNQHSLHDIYVHGGLYPTHACTQCWLSLMHVHGSLSRSLPSLLLAFTCTKREYCFCIQTP